MTRRPNLLKAEDLLPPPVQQRSIDKRDRLRAAALALFARRSFSGTSVDDIAEKAELAAGSFYQHYRSKRQLLLVLMDDLLERLTDVQLKVDRTADPSVLVSSILTRAFQADLDFLGACRAWSEAALSDPGIARLDRQIRAWTLGRIEAMFAAFQRLPGARAGVDTVSLARLVDRLFWDLLSRATQMSRSQLDDALAAAAHLIHHGLFLDARARQRQ